GGSVARAILESKKYEVRALARDVTQPNGQVLRDLGADVVKGDLNDKASVEASLKGAFMVTNFWDHFSKEKEMAPLPMGDVPMDGISVADVGEVICSIFNLPEKFVGKIVGLSAEAQTVQQHADALSKGLGKEVRDAEITLEAYEKLEFSAAKEMANMCHFYRMKPDCDSKLTHRLNPKVKSFSQLISKNQSALKGI
ncbi:hypothetical protein EI555_021158, partial [Monodon monoceros]